MHPKTQLPDRFVARRVIYKGREYGLSFVEIKDGRPIIRPFTCETHSTVFLDGTITIPDTI